MSFQQGLSGLNAQTKALGVIGNNIANSGTVGYKQGRALFQDVYANKLGIGTSVSGVQQQFTQGDVSSSSNSLDISISGNGFFRMSNPNNDAVSYSRNGQFQLDKEGFIVNAQSDRLTGYGANTDGVLQKGQPIALQIDASDLRPEATTSVKTKMNLDSRNEDLTVAAFDPNDPDTYHNTTAISVYDSLGNAHTLQSFYVKTNTNEWSVFVTADGVNTVNAATTTPPYTPNGTIQYPATGSGVDPTFTPTTGIPVSFAPLNSASAATGAANPVSITLDLTETTQFGSAFSVNDNQADGFTSGQLSTFTTANDGTIVGRYTNGQSRVLGQVALANFVNKNGLEPLGGNAWAETNESGQPLVGDPGTGLFGTLQSNSYESSNVNLTEELVNMITAQRSYQANARTIKTQDQLLQTIVNLR